MRTIPGGVLRAADNRCKLGDNEEGFTFLQMSEEQLKAFWDAIQTDTVLQQKLQGLTEPLAITAIAEEAGFSISVEELQKALSELSDEWLEGASGGYCADTRLPTSCSCLFRGEGVSGNP